MDKKVEDVDFLRTITDEAADDVIRESLRVNGWHPMLPPIDDEYGVRLVGNRRTRIAKELGNIEIPPATVLTLGDGEAADIERVKLAVVSNIGGVPLTAADRKRIAIHIYQTRSWAQQVIGEALGVSKMQVSRYLADVDCNPALQSKAPAKTERNPKGSGRHKGPPKPKAAKKNARDKSKTPEAEAAAIAVLDGRMSLEKAAAEAGFNSDLSVRRAVAREEGRREKQADPDIDKTLLSMTAQQKLDAAIRQHQMRLDAEYSQRRAAEIEEHIKKVLIPLMQKRLDDADRTLKARRGVMTRSEYRTIRACLHPDILPQIRGSNYVKQDGDEKINARYSAAFRLFDGLEIVLCNEREIPTERIVLTPEMMAARREEVRRQNAERRRAPKGKANVKVAGG